MGFPVDEGVRRNRGRPGAAAAPAAIRDRLRHRRPDAGPSFAALVDRLIDAGDVPVSGDLEADQQRLGTLVARWLKEGALPIIIGGGHETTFGHFLGYALADRDVAILNWDAHPDVRPTHDGLGHSGSPFRQALLHSSRRCLQYFVAGLLPARLDPAHLQFVTGQGGEYARRETLTPQRIEDIYARMRSPLMTTFDMDAVDESIAPGVSAPAQGGLTADLWLRAAYLAGRHPHTASMDLVEVNPRFDQDGRTVTLAADTIWQFLRGAADRPGA